MAYRFEIPGPPAAKGRGRPVTMGKGVRMILPKKTQNYQALVALAASQAGVKPLDGPVLLQVDAYLPRPKRLCRKKDPDWRLPCPHRPDLDNIVKAVKDGLNGIAWRDDAQVVSILARKYYHEKGGSPRCRVLIDSEFESMR